MKISLRRVAGWFLIVNGAIGTYWVTKIFIQYEQITWTQLIVALLFPASGLLSGFFFLRGRQWAAWLGMLFYGVQVFRYHSDSFNFDWRSGFEILIRPGTIEESMRSVPILEINFAAMIFLIVQAAAISRCSKSDTETITRNE